MLNLVRSAGISTVVWQSVVVTVDLVRAGRALADDEQCDFVISFGGGSVIVWVSGAALQTQATYSITLEVVGRGKPGQSRCSIRRHSDNGGKWDW
jgi:alcohol dehydrogenase class IV